MSLPYAPERRCEDQDHHRAHPLIPYRTLVVATHGLLDDQTPYVKEPALVLTQVGTDPTEPARDGFLTLREILTLPLQADLVALTACSTGLGAHLTGEGVTSLGRAVQIAGAKSVLMSLWSVEEASTVLLTERFFTYLRQGQAPLAALRTARADVRKAGYEHPFFWAPFILVGE